MTYTEALDYIFTPTSRRPEPGLERIRELLDALGRPQDKLRFVHVAGTNGKGSTCAMLESVLRAAGYRTGLFTSPHLARFNERIRVCGAEIGDDELADICTLVKEKADAMAERPTVFELICAIGMVYFARRGCDVVVLEVGLGGRYDATNVIDCPDCAVICAIGLDHTEILGGTVEQIALEKAGIIKPGCAVAVYQPEEESVISALAGVCRERGASLRIADFDEIEVLSDDLEGQEFLYCDEGPYFIPLPGDHQSRNAAVVLEAVEILRERGFKKLKSEAVEQGLAAAVWPARFETVSREPWFIVDGGHNAQCARSVRENVEYYFPDVRHVFLIGMLGDKDSAAVAAELQSAADVFVTIPTSGPRGMSGGEMADKLREYGKPVLVCGSIAEGIATAIGAAKPDGMVCAVGSLHTAGEIRAYFGLE